jgi:formylglycine-generating enzyme required for sulfatase activity
MNRGMIRRMPWRAVAVLMLLGCAAAHGAPLPPAGCAECHTGADHRLFKVDLKGGKGDCAICHGGVRADHVRLAAVADGMQVAAADPAPVRAVKAKAKPLKVSKPPVTDEPNPMVLIPAGNFIMGSDTRMPDEGPQHTVYLKDYYIDVYEVTNAQYKKFIDATHRRSPSHFRNRTYPPGKADHPVTEVTWYDADAYCTWAGKRLPTNEEWEKAARGTDGRMFPWGNEFDPYKANTPQRWDLLHQPGDTMPVGSFPDGVSPYGIYDMSGNVWEWTSSWYEAYPGNAHPSENYGEIYKELKGGSWWDCSFYKCGISAPVFNRGFFIRGTHNKSFGFRCAKDAAPGDSKHQASNNVIGSNP